MPYSAKLFACVTCGAWFTARRPVTWDARCINCAIERSVENARQLRAGEGMFYERWAAGLARAAARAAAQVELSDQAQRRGR